MFHYINTNRLQILREKYSNDIIISIDSSIVGERALIDHISTAIKSPYSDDNWDGLFDVLLDRSWIGNNKVVIIHNDLPMLDRLDIIKYLGLLFDASEIDENWFIAKTTLDSSYNQQLLVYFTEDLKSTITGLLQTPH